MSCIVICRASERRVHDDEVVAGVGDGMAFGCGDELAVAGDGLGASGKGGQGFLGGQEIERAKGIFACILFAVGHGQHHAIAEGLFGVGGGEHGEGEVDGHGENVTADEDALQHVTMESAGIATVELVQGGEALVDGGEQGTGAAGEIGDAQIADSFRIAPALVIGNGQGGEEGGRFRARVEGGQEFAVGDEALEDEAGQVVRAGGAAADDLLDDVEELGQDGLGGSGVVNTAQDFAGDVEDGVVVDAQDGIPILQDFRFVELLAE